MYTGFQRQLMQEVRQYASLGYTVGLARGKDLTRYRPAPESIGMDWDGISIIMDGVVCVDFDTPFITLGEEYPLPPTLKEKSNRGLHLFYRVPTGFVGEAKIHWKENIDLLVAGKKKVIYNASGISKSDILVERVWGQHVLVSPSKGYTRVYPDVTPAKDKLTLAPTWLMDAIGV